MENKLTLEHLTPYLPYRLKGIFQFNDEKCVLVSIDYFRNQISVFGKTLWNDLDVSEFKPILRPLSDLTKEIEHNGEKFVPCEQFKYDMECMLKECDVDLDCMSYNVINSLIEWHFDIFGLIDKNLAVDINTLKGE